jgi:CRP-like cAMP-binding protein
MSKTPHRVANSVLAALPRTLLKRLDKHLACVKLEFGAILSEPGDLIRQVYFPQNAVISLLTIVEGHLALEVGLVGREGMVGIPLALGVDRSPVRVLVQGSGTALSMDAAPFLKALEGSAPLQQELNRYTHALMTQVTQTAACNRFHLIEGRLARWLLMTRDRAQSPAFRLTHDFLANMLGVRRVGVTEAASGLQRRSLIEYSRGNIVILSHRGLEAASCACYEVVRDMHDGAARQQSWNRDS